MVELWYASRMRRCAKCGDQIPNKVVIDDKLHNLYRRRVCVACSPVGMGNRCKPAPLNHCSLCPNKLASRRHGAYCPSCITKIRRHRTKLAAIEFMGGQCQRCGWSGHVAGFDFHHLGDKDFAIGMTSNKSWGVVVQELKKCILLCSICHRIEHSDRQDEKFVAAVRDYNGRLLKF